MSIFEKTVITEIFSTTTIFSEKGRKAITENRPYWGLSFCISGQITYTHNNEKFISNSKNAVLLPKGATYSINGDKEGLFPIINFECDNLETDTIVVIPLTDSKSYIKDYKTLSNCFLFENKILKNFNYFIIY